MQIGPDGFFHLTYCTKIHPGNGWQELFRHLRAQVPRLRAKLSPDQPFGLGLRLSAAECEEVLTGGNLEELQAFLAAQGLYVFTMNGFPYGAFHGSQRVKSQVFAPDWQEEARVRYTLRLLEILRQLLPLRMEGSISTSPLSYKPWVKPGDRAALERITINLAAVVQEMARIREEDGKLIHLDLEPEPDGLVENSTELAAFFRDWLLPKAAPLLARKAGIALAAARQCVLTHLRVCLDTCHLAVAYEDPAAALDSLDQEGIKVGKVQITAGLKVLLPQAAADRASLARQLQDFADSPYLHQVLARSDRGGLRQFPDMVEALPTLAASRDREWRVHFHTPLFVARHGLLFSTRDETQEVLNLLRERGFCRHLEIETYTWEILPPDLKKDLVDSLELEYLWVLDNLVGIEKSKLFLLKNRFWS
ncbi:MAG: metabolite traffic protein EboE [Desulfobaccales bacterium]